MELDIKGKTVIIDDCDYDLIKDINWYIGCGYVMAKVKVRGGWATIKMHNYIGDTPCGVIIDHINQEPLDNRRCNLRRVTASQNAQNFTKRKSCSSKYKGVSWKKSHKKWSARICIKGKGIHIGHFNTEEEAAKAYDKKALELYGKNAATNF